MIPITKAIDIVLNEIGPIGDETVELSRSVGRVLAENIKADSDLPPFDRSQMDGFAVRASDAATAPILLKIAGESAAGKGWNKTLKQGEAVRIMTGAPVPTRADAVQKVELTVEGDEFPQLSGDTVTILEPTIKGRYIVPKGYEVKMGATVFAKGALITPAMIAGLASFGYNTVRVAAMPRIAILATGSEIVDVSEKPGKDQIRNSNSPMLQALVEQIGCRAEVFPIAKDDISVLKTEICSAAESADAVIITGGVSVGKYDLTKTSLSDIGANILFDRIRLKPGKPTVFAKLGKAPIFGLPGNPVSVAVTFHLFVRAAVRKMQGGDSELEKGFALLAKPAKGTKERDSYLPALLKTDKTGRLVAEPLKWHGSSDFLTYARAEALIIVPRGKSIEKGDVAQIVRL
jgi:molybdenum cofactor synthesis domain-containing protein